MDTNDYRNYLMHHGILGMKWGVRRYQNADGSLTSAGRRHYGYSSYGRTEREKLKAVRKGNRKIAVDKILEQNIKDGKHKPDISAAEKMVKDASKTVDLGHDFIRAASSLKKKKRSDLSSISDKELREKVNRLQLERQYRSLTNEDTSKGEEMAHKILDIVGPIVGIGGTVIGTIALVKSFKK